MIQLDKNYRVEVDSVSWTLIYEKEGEINQQTGKPVLHSKRSYHATLKNALIAYFDESLAPCQNVQEVLDMINCQIELLNNLEKQGKFRK